MIVSLDLLINKTSTSDCYKRQYLVGCFLISLLLLSGCMKKVTVAYVPGAVQPIAQQGGGPSSVSAKDSTTSKLRTVHDKDVADSLEMDQLENYFKRWQGVRYRFGGLSTKGVDCSGLTVRAYREFYGVDLPRTVARQARKGTPVEKKHLRPGDLVFFKTGRFSRHVGIYLGDNQFVHASRSQGVMVSNLNNAYWRKRYWQAKRLLSKKS